MPTYSYHPINIISSLCLKWKYYVYLRWGCYVQIYEYIYSHLLHKPASQPINQSTNQPTIPSLMHRLSITQFGDSLSVLSTCVIHFGESSAFRNHRKIDWPAKPSTQWTSLPLTDTNNLLKLSAASCLTNSLYHVVLILPYRTISYNDSVVAPQTEQKSNHVGGGIRRSALPSSTCGSTSNEWYSIQ